MKEDGVEVEKIIEKAEKSLVEAEKNFDIGNFETTISKSYYSMFHMATAVLFTKGLSFSKHSGVVSGFNQHFVKTGIFERKYSNMIDSAFKDRNLADYSYSYSVTLEDASETINNAKDFFEATKNYLLEFQKNQQKNDDLEK